MVGGRVVFFMFWWVFEWEYYLIWYENDVGSFRYKMMLIVLFVVFI